MSKFEDTLEITFRYYETFYSISFKNYQEIIKECNRRDNTKGRTDDDIDIICECNAKIQGLAITTVVFSCMCIESYINCYGVSNFSKSYFENYLDKLDLKSKWVVIPKLVTGNQIKTDLNVFEKLENVITLRNKLVHDKPKIKKVTGIKDTDWVREEDAKVAIDTVKELVIELSKIDHKIDTNWIKETETDPYA